MGQIRVELQPPAYPQPRRHQIRAMSVSYTSACGNAGSLTHWVRPGIKPASPWILVRSSISCWATAGTPRPSFFGGEGEHRTFSIWKLSGWGSSQSCNRQPEPQLRQCQIRATPVTSAFFNGMFSCIKRNAMFSFHAGSYPLGYPRVSFLEAQSSCLYSTRI